MQKSTSILLSAEGKPMKELIDSLLELWDDAQGKHLSLVDMN
jgi:hypothetical protein